MIAWVGTACARGTGAKRAAQQAEEVRVQLRFEMGDASAPRGHAVLFARVSGGAVPYLATYCVVLPISFSMAKYLPPMFSGQFPAEAMGEGMSVVPIPPMLEDVADLGPLKQLAERRGDDLCDIGTIAFSNDGQRATFAAEACQEYGELYAAYQRTWPATPVASSAGAGPSLDDVDMNDVMAEILPERARLAELSRLIGQARYAIEGGDRHALDEATLGLKRIARTLPEKFRPTQLVEAALRTDTTGPYLAELYLQRAFKLSDEEYSSIPPLDEQIRALAQGDHPDERPDRSTLDHPAGDAAPDDAPGQ